MDNKVIDFKTQVNKKDLEAFTQALVETTTKLQVENGQLKEQVKHLEELLMNVNVPILGRSNIEQELLVKRLWNTKDLQDFIEPEQENYDKEAFEDKYDK